jgi:hypothetical protein
MLPAKEQIINKQTRKKFTSKMDQSKIMPAYYEGLYTCSRGMKDNNNCFKKSLGYISLYSDSQIALDI